jgi:hypothetical protein
VGAGVGVGGSGVEVGAGVRVTVGEARSMPTVATVRSTRGVAGALESDELQATTRLKPYIRGAAMSQCALDTRHSFAIIIASYNACNPSRVAG